MTGSDTPLHDLAMLLGPPAPEPPAELVVVTERWGSPPTLHLGARIVLWGRPALPAGTPVATAAGAAVAQGRAVATARRLAPDGGRVRAVHHIDPPALHSGTRARLRTALLRGALVELHRAGPAPERVVDRILAAAGARAPLGRLRLGSGGTLLTQLRLEHGPGVLRAAPYDRPGDPASTATALRALAADRRVPTLLGAGTVAGASWTVEGHLPGRRPRRLDQTVVDQVVGLCAGLPRTGHAATPHRDLQDIAGVLPTLRDRLVRVGGELADRCAGLPGVARHGDLWSGNLLVDRGRLTGVLDWDAYDPYAVPGTDLLHLLATERRLTSRQSLGQVFLEKPWEWGPARAAAHGYWEAVGVPEPTPDVRAAVGAAWWAAQVAGDLRRTPDLAARPRWVEDNVLVVLDRLEGSPGLAPG